jgi:homoserine dehydrogenase
MLTKMSEEGTEFSEALRDAQAKGYAEKDPTADVEGHDPCRKIAILTSMVCGRQVDFEDIHCEGITGITPTDIKYAKAMGRSIKLLATSKKVGDSYSCIVAPFMLPKDHPLCGVGDVFNGIFVHGNVLGDAMFYGSGAGKLPTASAVVADVVDMVKHQHTNIFIDWSEEKMNLVDYKDSKVEFFVRTSSYPAAVLDAFGHVNYVDADVEGETAFTTDIMTEGEFEEKVSKIDLISRIRLG